MIVELIRTPSRRRATARHVSSSMRKYDYVSADGRWLIQQYGGCGGGWEVIDTTGEWVCTTCAWAWDLHDGHGHAPVVRHATVVRTLSAAKAFITEWSA
jgi:hypothetical protein